jgi:putative oxidoreductase
MKTATVIAQYFLGALCLIFGANKFIGFMPAPAMPKQAMAMMDGIMAAGYIMPTLGVIFIICGILLFVGKGIPLALILLAPVTYNILMFHILLDPVNGVPAYLMTVLHIFLFVAYKDCFKFLCLCSGCCSGKGKK